jgi:hypothetical protein
MKRRKRKRGSFIHKFQPSLEEVKLLEFQSTPFTYGMESIADLIEQKDSVSIAGSCSRSPRTLFSRAV